MKVNCDITYVYVINTDAKMTKGKVAAQVSHCAMRLFNKLISQHPHVERPLGRCIILKASHADMLSLYNSLFFSAMMVHQADEGLNQVTQGTWTCIGFMQNANTQIFTRNMKLY